MRWPWSKTPEPVVEKRESFTNTFVNSILSSRGESALQVQNTAVATIAANQLGRTLSSGVLRPDSEMLRGMITPSVLNMIGNELIFRGEIVFWLNPNGTVVPCSFYDVDGGYDERTWRYTCSITGPSSHSTITVNSAEVLHLKYRVSPLFPWRGIGPLQSAGLTATLVSGLETMLSQEVSAASGYLLPVPEFGEGEDDPAQALKADLAKLKGRTTLVETSSNSYGEGRQSAPQRDFVPSRIGADPPGALVALREQAAQYLLAAAGYPVALLTPSGDGASKREALRQYQNFAGALARGICSEISLKLHVADCHIDLPSIQDVASRARAFGQLVAGGMDIEKAVQLAGLLVGDDDN